MKSNIMRPTFFFFSFLACAIMSLATGCASGGYKLTREYARWLNSQQLIIRILLYLFASFIFAITLLVDFVVFNTMDFWEGRISAGDYFFKQDGKNYYVKHELLPGTNLKRTSIRITDANEQVLQEAVLTETPNSEIELYIDGKLRTRVRDIHSLPVASVFDKDGNVIDTNYVLPLPVAARN